MRRADIRGVSLAPTFDKENTYWYMESTTTDKNGEKLIAIYTVIDSKRYFVAVRTKNGPIFDKEPVFLLPEDEVANSYYSAIYTTQWYVRDDP